MKFALFYFKTPRKIRGHRQNNLKKALSILKVKCAKFTKRDFNVTQLITEIMRAKSDPTNFEKIEKLFNTDEKSPLNINATDLHGKTAIHYLVLNILNFTANVSDELIAHNFRILELLLKQQANLAIDDPQGILNLLLQELKKPDQANNRAEEIIKLIVEIRTEIVDAAPELKKYVFNLSEYFRTSKKIDLAWLFNVKKISEPEFCEAVSLIQHNHRVEEFLMEKCFFLQERTQDSLIQMFERFEKALRESSQVRRVQIDLNCFRIGHNGMLSAEQATRVVMRFHLILARAPQLEYLVLKNFSTNFQGPSHLLTVHNRKLKHFYFKIDSGMQIYNLDNLELLSFLERFSYCDMSPFPLYEEKFYGIFRCKIKIIDISETGFEIRNPFSIIKSLLNNPIVCKIEFSNANVPQDTQAQNYYRIIPKLLSINQQLQGSDKYINQILACFNLFYIEPKTWGIATHILREYLADEKPSLSLFALDIFQDIFSNLGAHLKIYQDDKNSGLVLKGYFPLLELIIRKFNKTISDYLHWDYTGVFKTTVEDFDTVDDNISKVFFKDEIIKLILAARQDGLDQKFQFNLTLSVDDVKKFLNKEIDELNNIRLAEFKKRIATENSLQELLNMQRQLHHFCKSEEKLKQNPKLLSAASVFAQPINQDKQKPPSSTKGLSL